ncbi:26S proteasome regulatory subunit [Striga asiatica]|uniref:26S proteasome regulatory subunit n=1 Tax=Striga asiatica TaxID=4170 RepID=A0A5A7PD98_STRAF|nr:26S proteasome regulatory subunit [Striga asiatica]
MADPSTRMKMIITWFSPTGFELQLLAIPRTIGRKMHTEKRTKIARNVSNSAGVCSFPCTLCFPMKTTTVQNKLQRLPIMDEGMASRPRSEFISLRSASRQTMTWNEVVA